MGVQPVVARILTAVWSVPFFCRAGGESGALGKVGAMVSAQIKVS